MQTHTQYRSPRLVTGIVALHVFKGPHSAAFPQQKLKSASGFKTDNRQQTYNATKYNTKRQKDTFQKPFHIIKKQNEHQK